MLNIAIEARGLTKRFDDHLVLDAIDFTIEPARIVGYVGTNGSGKSTTFNILAGLLGDFEGSVAIHGHDMRTSTLEAQRLIGWMPEVPAVYETLTLAESCLLYGRLHDIDDAVIRRRAEPLLEAFDLTDAIGRPMSGLSKGMRQKATFTFALLHNPQVLFLDEPFSGLDAMSSLLLREMLRRLADAGKTIMLSSHALALVQEISDEIFVLHDTHIAARGTFDEISKQLDAASLEALIDELSGDDAEGRQRAIDRVMDAFS